MDKDQHKKKMYNHQDYTDTDLHTQNGKFIYFSVLQNQSILQVWDFERKKKNQQAKGN